MVYPWAVEMIKYPMRHVCLVISFIIILAGQALSAGTYGYSEEIEVVGMARYHRVENEETLYEIARKYNLGFNELKAANPSIIDPRAPGKGSKVLLPTKWVLPTAGEGPGVVVNIAEMRLYRFYASGQRQLVSSYPIGVAIEGFDTPLGRFSVSDKLVKPWWFVPDSIRREMPDLPEVVPPCEENPLGDYALRLSDTPYFIHGTNKPFGIGMRVSHGCIRLYPEDIAEFYSIVRLGDDVRVVYEPVKAGLRAGKLYLEVHDDYLGRVEDMQALAAKVLDDRDYQDIADAALVRQAVEERLGIPVMIGGLGEGLNETAEARDKKTPEPSVPGEMKN